MVPGAMCSPRAVGSHVGVQGAKNAPAAPCAARAWLSQGVVTQPPRDGWMWRSWHGVSSLGTEPQHMLGLILQSHPSPQGGG